MTADDELPDDPPINPQLIAAMIANPKACWAAMAAMRDNGADKAADDLALAIIEAGGRIPDGAEFMPDFPSDK